MSRWIAGRLAAPYCAAIALVVAAACFGTPAAADTQTRPTVLGVSGSSIEPIINNNLAYCYAGTLGSLVTDGPFQYILSNNHVLAKENNPDSTVWPNLDGHDIVQPGLLDGTCTASGGDLDDVVGYLTNYFPLAFGKGKTFPQNTVDAAVAETNANISGIGDFTSMVEAKGYIKNLGYLSYIGYLTTESSGSVNLGDLVQKTGRTTGHTFGQVSGVNVSIKVSYTSGTAYFVNQIEVTGLCGTTFSDAGDSGSLIASLPKGAARAAVGLLFAGGSSSTFANHIDAVLTALGGSLHMVAGGSGNSDSNNIDDVTGNTAVPTCSSSGGTGGGHGKPHVAVDPGAVTKAAQIADQHSAELFAVSGVLGYGIGADDSGHAVIRVYLEHARVPASTQSLPSQIGGIPVQVVITGTIKAY